MGWLEGQAAIVTGGASGLGRAVVDRFVQEGARVVVLDRSAEHLEKLRADHDRRTVVTVKGDVTSPAANDKAVAAAVKAFGQLDVFVGNAGIGDYAIPMAHLPLNMLPEVFDEVFGVNVKGYILGTKAALPELVKSRGCVIYTLSNAAFDPAGGGVFYTASKHAVRGLVTQLAYELAPKVRVNGVAPGGCGTDLPGPKCLGFDRGSLGGGAGLDGLGKAGTPPGVLPAAGGQPRLHGPPPPRGDSPAGTG